MNTNLPSGQSEAYKKITDLTKQFPNDQDLGREVRKLVNQIQEDTQNELDKKSTKRN